MQHIRAIASGGFRISTLAALGGLSTLVAAAGTTWLITGSSDPGVWVAAYKHAWQCAVADAALNTSCHAVAAVPAAEVHGSQRSPEPATTPSAEPPETPPPAGPTTPPAPQVAPAPVDSEPGDDEPEGNDS